MYFQFSLHESLDSSFIKLLLQIHQRLNQQSECWGLAYWTIAMMSLPTEQKLWYHCLLNNSYDVTAYWTIAMMSFSVGQTFVGTHFTKLAAQNYCNISDFVVTQFLLLMRLWKRQKFLLIVNVLVIGLQSIKHF